MTDLSKFYDELPDDESVDVDVVPAEEAEQSVADSGEGFDFFNNNPYAKRAEADPSYDSAAQGISDWVDESFPVVAAAFRRGNSVYLAKKAIDTGMGADDVSDFNLNDRLDESGIPEDGRHRFENVKNQKQFDAALEYYAKDSADARTLENEGWVRRLTAEVVAGFADPINYVPWAKPFQALKLLKYGSSIANSMVTAGIATGLNASVRMKVNNELDAYNVTAEFLAGAVTGGAFHKGVGALSQGLTKAVKYAVNTVDSKFKLAPDGTLMVESYGRFGTTLYKANRYLWEMFNNAPASQMRNSGDPVIEKMAGDIFGDRHQNLKGEGVVGIAADERLDMLYREEAAIAEARAQSRKAFVSEGYGSAEEFNEAVSQVRANTYVEINTGELHFGRRPDPVQTELFPQAEEAAVNQQAKNLEFRFYDKEHIENMTLSSTYNPAVMSDNPHVLSAAKEEIEFWRKIIKRAKDSGDFR